ncbi:MAG: hypothetical protein IT258_19355 [Saprospiraceae bacterium]|nr:hypothetical protein [Saprospiraceae bacterium]
MTFHAGKRLGNTLLELKLTYKISHNEVAEFMGIGYEMLTRYRKMAAFSPTVMHNIRYLEEMNIRDNFCLNSKHYEEENESRWLPSKQGKDGKSEISNEDVLKEVDRIATLLERKIESDNQFFEKILKHLNLKGKE